MKTLFLSLVLFCSSLLYATPIPYGATTNEKENIVWAFEKAQRFSNITSLDPENGWKRLTYFIVTPNELSSIACPDDPENCHGLAALYDTTLKRIFIRDDLNPDFGNMHLSFLIHEMVHALQNETRSDDEMFGTCQKLYNTEKQAYEAQDAFLKSEGEFFRAGGALRYFRCTDPTLN